MEAHASATMDALYDRAKPGGYAGNRPPARAPGDGLSLPAVANAGAKWEDSEVVVDQGVITSRNPGDLEAFSAKIIEEVKEGRHAQRSAA
jgi:putative intracellular protease/amidase